MNAPSPEFSVIVTTFERPYHLPRLLAALAAQHMPREEFEVLIVNDGGAVPLEPVLAPFGDRLNLHLFRQDRAGPAAGRNLGLAHARGRFVAFTDDDCEPAPPWLAALKCTFDTWPEAMAGGRIVNGAGHRVCSEASQLISNIVYGFYNAEPQNARFFSSNNMAAPAALLRALGGFDARFRFASEDRDLCERWRRAGRRMVLSPEAVVRHHHDLKLASFCAQHFRYGRGAALFHQLRAARRSSRLAEHFAFYRAWYTWPLLAWRASPGWRGVRLTALLAAWQMSNAAGFLYGALRDRVPAQSDVA